MTDFYRSIVGVVSDVRPFKTLAGLDVAFELDVLREAGYLANRIAVMRARPGRIVDDSVVPFARPRTIEVSFEPGFVSLTQRLRERIVAARAVQEIAS